MNVGTHMMTDCAQFFDAVELTVEGDLLRCDPKHFRCMIQADQELVNGQDGQQIFSDTKIYTDVLVPGTATIILRDETRERRQIRRNVYRAPDGRTLLEISV